MPFSRYKGYSLRNKIFWGFLLICILSILGSAVLSYFVLRENAAERSRTEMQNKSNSVMAAFDYAVGHSQLETGDLPKALENEIMEIADINKMDLVLYDTKGNFLMSNKDANLISAQKIPINIVNDVLKAGKRIDYPTYDPSTESTKTSSYIVLNNNMLEPIAIVHLPLYHNDSAYLEVFNRYVRYIVLVDIFIVILGIWLSWIISKNLTNALTKFSDKINRLTLFDKDMHPIKYYHDDELGSLVTSYNKMILQIQNQKERLRITEREEAWREMAKQVAHEVKNPLTPMKLTIQNFERKFDPEDPEIHEKVQKLSASLVEQIDMVATVATAFSQFAKLPDKNNEKFELKTEIENILGVFSNEKIYIHANKEHIEVNMDKIYLNRIVTNLVTNALQARTPERDLLVNVDIEQQQKRVKIAVEDNGSGIPDDKLDKIFAPNFTSKNSGMGLGLTMVRKMVEDYKGEISVKSEVGKGSVFTVLLPTNI